MSEDDHHNHLDSTIVTHPGSPHRLGAYYDGRGINFALYSEGATKVQLCLFRKSDDQEQEYVEYARINIEGRYCLSITHLNLSKEI